MNPPLKRWAIFGRPCGTWVDAFADEPTVETVGYFRASLRD
jgi:hypothetical protein